MEHSRVICLAAGVISLALLATGNLFSATTSTVTVTASATTTSTLTVAPICASLVNVTGQCRRRRSVEEQPLILILSDDEDQISPSAINLGGETTPAQTFPQSDVATSPQVESSHELVEILGLDSSCIQQGRFNFFVTAFTTTTSTRTVTATASTTKSTTATFFISRCTPSSFTFALCP